MSLIKFAALALAAATVSQVSGAHFSRHALAQSFGETPETFPIPGSLPDGTTLKVDGSTSMRFTNEDLKDRFEDQYANVDVELDASRTDQAFEALIEGDIDLLATGRPLTDDEKAQGVVEVPLEQREKLAIIVGPDNSFEGDLTFEQFARIFRGEITNWSEVGGEDLAIRLVDRPDYSDTRRALSTYTVFEGQPFATGTTADPVADDETDSVVTALGNDGIGYAVVSQVIERDDARIIPMHQTLPDDPRYPYSQYRAFVYKEGAGAAALAFLGFATTEPGQKVLETEAVTAAPATTPGADDAPATAAGDSPTTAPAPADESSSEAAGAAEGTEATEPAAGAAAGADTAGKGGFPFWLLP
ncbi:MAG: substrate-binding domain-containing protein, partial [Cyanobacteria bacterium J06607_17]